MHRLYKVFLESLLDSTNFTNSGEIITLYAGYYQVIIVTV